MKRIGDKFMLETTLRLKQTLESKDLPTKRYYKLSITEAETEIVSSKLGGCPFIPTGEKLPTSSSGNALYMIAQLNLSDFKGDICPLKEGILQFWLMEDDLFGLDFDDPCNQKDFRVIYYPKVTEHLSKDEVMSLYSSENETEYFPLENPLTTELLISGTEDSRRITPEDFKFEDSVVAEYNKLFPDNSITGLKDIIIPAMKIEEDDALVDELLESFDDNHCLMGYPTFTQNDPRETEEYEEYVMLFQVDSDTFGETELLWGDCGIGNWFIHPDDLKKGDFSKVIFNWDCS